MWGVELSHNSLCSLRTGSRLGLVRASRVWSRASGASRERSGDKRKSAWEPVDILLLPSFLDISSWYQDLIGYIEDC